MFPFLNTSLIPVKGFTMQFVVKGMTTMMLLYHYYYITYLYSNLFINYIMFKSDSKSFNVMVRPYTCLTLIHICILTRLFNIPTFLHFGKSE